MRAVPVINENDTVATSEIRYGDNDRLAARVATMASADLLILLSDVDGLYDAPPQRDPSARLIPVVERLTPQIEAMAGGAASEASRGGMRTKIEAAQHRRRRRRAYGDRRRPNRPSDRPRRRRRTLHLVPDPVQSGDGAQDVDRRHAGAEGFGDDRRRRGQGAQRAARACCRPASSASKAASRAATASPFATKAGSRSAAASSPMTRSAPSASAAATRATSPRSSARPAAPK